MGLSASQARFLQLTARRSNLEYQAQQINFERLQLASKLEDASNEYQDAISNRTMVFSFNSGDGIQKVDITYNNYKNYMNQQLEGLSTTQSKYYLVSSTGQKIIVSSEEERDQMIKESIKQQDIISEDDIKAKQAAGEDVSAYSMFIGTNEDGKEYTYYAKPVFTEKDFKIVENLDDTDFFQNAIKNGTFYFAKHELSEDSETGAYTNRFITQGWDVLGGGAILEEYDKTDDAEAEAKFQRIEARLQKIDKTLELELDQIESERSAIQTEIESVSKVIDDNIESSFKTFS
ncbi:MAG: hypothetical protein IJ003_04670 [Candidatus Gastranaerophilales bacterium]|nr:hypothetical protein [Candidatus Gastranaerophilales bacterium]